MNLKLYKNELIVAVTFVLMLFAFLYKNSQVSSQAERLFEIRQSVREFKEIIEHKRIWADKSLSKKIDKFQTVIPVSKGTWTKKGKKLTARLKDISPKELNRFMTKMMSLAVQITELDIKKSGENYNVEFKCKW
jgi:hypothetical protein